MCRLAAERRKHGIIDCGGWNAFIRDDTCERRKNAALPILAASLLSERPVALYDCPAAPGREEHAGDFGRARRSLDLDEEKLLLDTSAANAYVMPQGLSKELRSSIFMLGPLLARFGHAVCTFPGGCEIGHRPIDLHLRGLTMLGVGIREEHGLILCDGHSMTGADIHLDYPSVGATENIMMAAVRAEGETVIQNAAREPEIEDLQTFLRKLGYAVWGAGSSTIRISGGRGCADHMSEGGPAERDALRTA